MIIFYRKTDGKIVGTVEGRIHTKAHLNMWIGSWEENDKLVINWEPVKDYKNDKGEIIAQDFEPKSEQKELFVELDKQPTLIKNYKIDLKTKLLVPNEAKNKEVKK